MKRAFRPFVALIVFLSGVYAGDAERSFKYFAGVNVSYNKRHAQFVFSETNQGQAVEREPAMLFGAIVGRSFYPGNSVGLRFVWTADFGNTREGLLSEEYQIKHRFLRFGFRPDIQFFLPRLESISPYLHAGGGIEYLRFDERFYSGNQPYIFPGQVENMQARTWCFSLHGGIGAELVSKKDWGVDLVYWLSHSTPVKTTYARELPISSIKYQERIMSHQLHLIIHFHLSE